MSVPTTKPRMMLQNTFMLVMVKAAVPLRSNTMVSGSIH